MSFSWKKVKCTKITRFVNDHLHNSQKRRDGSSLVVETGFPTSLVDLFMKNREKLRKKKCAVRTLTFPPIDVNDPVISRSLAPSTTPARVITDSPVNEISAVQECDDVTDEIVDMKSSVVVSDNRERRRFDANGVFLAVLKMVLVVILASRVKRLTLGITLSAFLLFLLDYLGKHVNLFVKPWSEAERMFKILMLRFKEDMLDHKKGSAIMPEEFMNQEIQPVEIECDSVTKSDKIGCENEIKEESHFDERLKFGETKLKDLLMENDDFTCGVVESGMRKSKKDKTKWKVKKYFIKKLRKCKKEEHLIEIFSEDRVSLSEELESDQCKNEEESESLTGLSANCAFGGFSETSNGVAIKMKNGIKEQESIQIWSCLVLGLIVLIGLIRGRSFALILTLSWFLLLKLGETLQKTLKSVYNQVQ